MAEKPADKSQESPKKALDLNTLSGLDFGPSWADEKAKRPSQKQYESRGDSRGKGKRSGGSGSRYRGGPGGGRPNGLSRPPCVTPRGGAAASRGASSSSSSAPAALCPTSPLALLPHWRSISCCSRRSTFRNIFWFQMTLNCLFLRVMGAGWFFMARHDR